MAKINEDIQKNINIREIYRYLGYGINVPDDTVKSMVKEVLEELIKSINPKCIYKIYDSSVIGDKVVLHNTICFHSQNLADNLKTCCKVVLFAATLGIEADKLMQRYAVLNMAKGSIAQSCGAACIEAYCDLQQEKICSEISDIVGSKLYLRPRFSPGYGDLALQNQELIFHELDCTKRIGLTLTDSLLMVPTKSVTAFIGLTQQPQGSLGTKCENCNNKDCNLRKA